MAKCYNLLIFLCMIYHELKNNNNSKILRITHFSISQNEKQNKMMQKNNIHTFTKPNGTNKWHSLSTANIYPWDETHNSIQNHTEQNFQL